MSLSVAVILMFLSSFFAATLFPAQSEGIFLWLISLDQFPVWILFFAASLGNVLGSCINWILGKYMNRWKDKKWFPFSIEQFKKAEYFFQRYGVWSLLGAWLPVIGDPLTLAAGVLNVKFSVFLIYVILGKAGRYLFLLWGAEYLLK